MAKNEIPRKVEYLIEMLKVMQNGDDLYAGEPFKLTAELRQKVDDSLVTMESAKLDKVDKEGKKEKVVQNSTILLKDALKIVSRVKSYLVSQLPQLQKDKTLQGYLLDQPLVRKYNDVLRVMSSIIQENTNQAGEAWELPADLLAELTTKHDDMAIVQVEVEAAKGAYLESSQHLKNSIASGIVIARRVREFLYAMLPERKKDMKLKEFGLDPWD